MQERRGLFSCAAAAPGMREAGRKPPTRQHQMENPRKSGGFDNQN